ncbi:hypothetical protein [Paenibacillus sp. XY044]|uniref:hypothetical protein n=1 Tax=Paenibacillus sp. XY044 TaxID=2026089 RepID=UPI0015C5B809|nr:hypothetical protein [Paenibacillus sp. XY044]
MIDFPERFIKSSGFDLLGHHAPEVNSRPLDEHTYHCTLTFKLVEEVRQDDWQMWLIPAFRPDFHWAPHLAPTDRHKMDQHCFRSPALIAQEGSLTLILIPDLDLLSQEPPVRWYMDLDAPNNRLVLGMGNTRVDGHVLFEKAPGASYQPGYVSVGFYLMMFEDGDIAMNPWRPALEWMWRKWGGPQFREGAPRVAPLLNYVRHTYHWAFHHWKDEVWQQFELDGRMVGAPVFIVDVSQSPNYPGIPSERESRSIWNQAWFSSLRSAQGLYRYGQEQGDPELERKALLAKELALAAPQRGGFFPAVIATEMRRVMVDGQEVNRSGSWDASFWGNSNRNPLFPWGSIADAPYHVLDMSWTALLMLRWYDELEPDHRLVEYAMRYADALLSLQVSKGYFPAWLDQRTLEPVSPLAESPETSLSVTFLLKMHEIVPDPKYRDAALSAMEVVLSEIVPDGRWEDFETYWSCCSYGQKDLPGNKVVRNNMYKQCNFSMYWTAEALYYCYQLTGDRRYLDSGQRCLDELLMTQASWQPPYIYVETLGGFGVMNCDGEWNDARQSLFAELILLYGLELDRAEYIERGIAALRASFVMMYCPENSRTRDQWEKVYPFFNEKDYGFMMENYGHGGETNAEGLGMGTFTIYDWGNGAAAEAYMRIKSHLSGVLKERYHYEI